MTDVGTWQEAERFARRRAFEASPEARLAWLQRTVEFAHAAGAIQLEGGRHLHETDREVAAFDRVRTMCHAFPDVERASLQGRPLFRVGKRRFAIFNSSWAPDRPRWRGQGCSLHFLADPSEAEALRSDPRFSSSPHHGDRGWFALRLDTDDVDWHEVAELLASAHAQVTKGSKHAGS